MLTNVVDIYNELYDVYKSKYSKKIDKLSAKDKEKLDYKKLRLSDYLHSSEEEEEEKPTKDDYKTLIKQIIDLIKKQISTMIYLTNILNFKDLVICSCF